MLDLAKIENDNILLQQQFQQLKLEYQHEVYKRKETESALRESEERFRSLVELSPDAIILHSEQKFIFGNLAALSLFRISSMQSLIEKSIFDFMNEHQARLLRESMDRMVNGSVLSLLSEYSFFRPDGEEFSAEVTANKLKYSNGISIQFMIRDITERSKNERQRIELEQQLLHIQKKEIISTLASGIAHDILNILGIIGTAINKLTFLKDIDKKSLSESAEQISMATERGRALVRQLLTFAKKSELNFDLVQVNPIIAEIVSVIQRTFPEIITIEMKLSDNLPSMRADANQIHQALLNLCLNARDAIGDSGMIIISSSIADKIGEEQQIDSVNEYICISVSDNGCGMSQEVKNNIFQPFFTTKHETEGSGLGLAMVNGIIENHRGFIELESEIGKGTTFKLYFPI